MNTRVPLRPVLLLKRLVDVEPHEIGAALWSFAYFFLLLCGYYILRPLRDEMGIAGGVQQLHWVFTGTFIAMIAAVPLFGAVSARFPRRRLLPIVYYFFIINILIFFALFQLDVGRAYVARAFFIWTSVFNLFVVSVFWSFMVDLYTNSQARRLFGFIAAGGSAGAVAGPLLTTFLAAPFGTVNLLLLSALLLGGAVVCIHALLRWGDQVQPIHAAAVRQQSALGGGMWTGVKLVISSRYLLGIALFIWLFTTLSTFLYFAQAHIVAAAFDNPAERTALFAKIDFAVNVLTIVTQALFTGRIIRGIGVPATLALVPTLTIAGFAGLAFAPLLPVLIGFQVLRRAGDYALTRPVRELLFTVVGREAKYKAKNVIDTVIYRGGDAVSGWLFVGLKSLGLGLAGIAWVGVPIAAVWAAVAWRLGREQEKLRADGEVLAEKEMVYGIADKHR